MGGKSQIITKLNSLAVENYLKINYQQYELTD